MHIPAYSVYYLETLRMNEKDTESREPTYKGRTSVAGLKSPEVKVRPSLSAELWCRVLPLLAE